MYATGATVWATDSLLSRIERDQAADWHIQAQGIEGTLTMAMASPIEGEAHLLSGGGDINDFALGDLESPQLMVGLPVFPELEQH